MDTVHFFEGQFRSSGGVRGPHDGHQKVSIKALFFGLDLGLNKLHV